MNCPSCLNSLSPLNAMGAQLDACSNGCGGLWFELNELAKFEDLSEQVPPNILRVKLNSETVIDCSIIRHCPKCVEHPLEVKMAKETLGVEMDECPNCLGIWLDLGELTTIRDDRTFISEMDRAIEETEKLRKGNEFSWPKGLKAVLKLLFK